jgi:hypothetical protein
MTTRTLTTNASPAGPLARAARLDDDELLACLPQLASRERSATAELIAHLAEMEARRLHLTAGYGSMFAYCREVLGLTEHATYNRLEAARAASRFPVILELLVQRAVSLTAVRLVAPHLTAHNHVAVLESTRGLRTRDVETIVARLAPKADVAASVRKLPAPRSLPLTGPTEASLLPRDGAEPAAESRRAIAVAPETAASPETAPNATPTTPTTGIPGASAATIAAAARAEIRPLSPDRYKLQLTISGETLEKIGMAKDLLRHAVPSGDDAEILDRAFTELLEALLKKKFAATDQPRRSKGVAPDSREIPAEVKRAVYLRDLGRCAFVGKGGHRCNERAFLELHHVHPYSQGGPPTVENIQLRCRQHNAHEWHQRSTAVRLLEEAWYMQRDGAARTGAPRELVSKRVGVSGRNGPAPTSSSS